nr:hypothetical protein [Tanacetum cinerariifolium]
MGRGVQQLKFGIDTGSYSVMMNKFIASGGLDREFGFTSLEMTASKTSSDSINIVFKKRTLYEVAIHDGHQLYEIGLKDDGLRHFKDASFTEFGESYPTMVGSLHGLRIDREDQKLLRNREFKKRCYQREKEESRTGLKFWEMEQRDIEWNISHRNQSKDEKNSKQPRQ